jgi:choloylglycine hydrolase
MKRVSGLCFLLFISVLLSWGSGWTCTSFILKSGNLQVFGRNYDWGIGDGLLVVNKRGCNKRSVIKPFEKGKKAIWTAKYGSITFNQYGRELPIGGMNEAGLVVESMYLPETRYPDPDDRPYLGAALQWRQYLLDTCATVGEVIASDKAIRVSNRARGPGVHLLILDKNGDSAVLEFINGRMQVLTGTDLPVAVLTNDTYAKSLKCMQTNSPPIFESTNSITRFITAAEKNQDFQGQTIDELVDFAFETLAAVSMARTRWRIVYDNKNMQVYFRTKVNYRIRHISVSDFDFSPSTPVKILDVNANLSGDITQEFSDYTYDANRDLIDRAYNKTGFLSGIPAESRDRIARLPEHFVCR